MIELEFYGGIGFEGLPEKGKYEVDWGYSDYKKFNSYAKAKKFYDSLNATKAFWNLSGSPELIHAMVEKSPIKENDDYPF